MSTSKTLNQQVPRIYLSKRGLADVMKRVSAEERERLQQLVESGEITIVGPGGDAQKEKSE
jgi:uncharacterized protein YciI